MLKENPVILAPVIGLVILGILISLARLGLIGGIALSIIRFLVYSILVAYTTLLLRKGVSSFTKAWEKVTALIITLIVIAIISAVFMLTIILIPVAIFLIPIAIIDEANISETIKRAFNFVAKHIKEVIVVVIVLLVIGIISYAATTLIARADPRIAGATTIISNTITETIYAYFTILATILYYIKTRGETPATKEIELPPPPPPPT